MRIIVLSADEPFIWAWRENYDNEPHPHFIVSRCRCRQKGRGDFQERKQSMARAVRFIKL
jgi:NADH:ubiquinone oxidoreductase subunit B-like Fe-S oxidoreductase